MSTPTSTPTPPTTAPKSIPTPPTSTPILAPATSALAFLDPAIAERILTILAPKKLAPHKRLVPLLRVNKHWHALILPRLYTAITLKNPWVARPLRRTLERNTALAALVEELVLDTELSSQDPAETRDHQRVVAACPNVRHLTVLGYASPSEGDGDVVGKYRKAIAGRTKLETLHVSEGAGMWTFAQLLEMLRGWPQLEKLILKDTLLPADASSFPSNSPPSTPPTPTPPAQGPPCARLKMVKITDTLDPSRQFSLAAFAAIAPSISVLWIEPRPEHAPVVPADLLDGVRAWAPTLEALYLLADAEPHLPVLPALTALTHLSVHASSSSSIPALLRSTTPSLTALTLRLPPAALPALVEALAGLRVASIPASHLTATPPASHPPPPPPPSTTDTNPNSPLDGGNQNSDGAGAGKAPTTTTIPALPAPSLRALTITFEVQGAVPLPARADVGKGKGRSLREVRGGAGSGLGGGVTGSGGGGVAAPAVVQALKNGAFLFSLLHFSSLRFDFCFSSLRFSLLHFPSSCFRLPCSSFSLLLSSFCFRVLRVFSSLHHASLCFLRFSSFAFVSLFFSSL
ncbi:hypothetical protein B0H11DRAFT_184167 [Mycena galericulata]|nr:hypothetical protein B0H11DRAFT_184167 [Mycena galericulata]